MKPAQVVDEMFPEGAGPYTEEEVKNLFLNFIKSKL